MLRFLVAFSFLLASGCTLSVISGFEDGGAASAGGGSTSGGHSTSGGGSTTGPSCAGVSCAPFYACDPNDGLCKCGGQVCNSGNCNLSGACLQGCEGDAGMLTIAGSSGPGSAFTPPLALFNEFYSYQLSVACAGSGYVVWTVCSTADGGSVCDDIAKRSLPPGLELYPNGQIWGYALEAGLFEFLVKADFGSPTGGPFNDGGVFQNVSMTVERDAGPSQ